ncbi:glycosyltransferase [Demequina sediminicola]|uniref:glycosyltransferase n=1 Tax=Demequina sediminicola TaxID=1095026 RepID=UPI00137912AE|nr:glycosyltransferase family 4 protein [Demequina sediminicola]
MRRRARTAASPWAGVPVSDAQHRLLIAPANFAGQGAAWAHALNSRHPNVAAETWTHTAGSGFAFPSTHTSPRDIAGLPAAWHRRVFDDVATHFTHVVMESGRPLFGPLLGFDPLAEARALADRGVTVAMLWHGTDIRQPSIDAPANPHSPFHDTSRRGHIAALQARARRNHALAEAWEGPQLFTTPDLAAHVPHGTWVPVVVDPAPWTALTPAACERPLRVLHLPSNPWIKGTHDLGIAVESLDPERVSWLTPGRMDASEVPAAVERADVVADQFRLNLYGVAAVEAMFAGRAVVALAGEPLRDAVRRETGEELPIAATTPAELADRLHEWSDVPAAPRELAARARDYALRWHDGKETARRLSQALGFAPSR